VSASEIERMGSRDGSKKKVSRRQHASACRVEAVQHCLRAREADPKKTMKECAKELGASEKTLDDWVVRCEAAGKVGRGRTEGQRALDEANRRIVIEAQAHRFASALLMPEQEFVDSLYTVRLW
jgi:hypothetical protein